MSRCRDDVRRVSTAVVPRCAMAARFFADLALMLGSATQRQRAHSGCGGQVSGQSRTCEAVSGAGVLLGAKQCGSSAFAAGRSCCTPKRCAHDLQLLNMRLRHSVVVDVGNPRARCKQRSQAAPIVTQLQEGKCDYEHIKLSCRHDGGQLLTCRHQQFDAHHQKMHDAPFRNSDVRHKDCFGAGQAWEACAPVQEVKAAVVTA